MNYAPNTFSCICKLFLCRIFFAFLYKCIKDLAYYGSCYVL